MEKLMDEYPFKLLKDIEAQHGDIYCETRQWGFKLVVWVFTVLFESVKVIIA